MDSSSESDESSSSSSSEQSEKSFDIQQFYQEYLLGDDVDKDVSDMLVRLIKENIGFDDFDDSIKDLIK